MHANLLKYNMKNYVLSISVFVYIKLICSTCQYYQMGVY
jgi:hypothetical protein